MQFNFNDEISEVPQNGKLKLIIALFFISLVVLLKITGITENIEIDTLRNMIDRFGVIAPVVYILIVTIAPAFMLPGSPFIIAGGILFGSFWGVVYGITGATTGACLAFMISRYLLRNLIESKLTSPKWKNLIEQTEIHGWKIVAVTRLVPLVPFNLLSYALGLTRIKFSHYALTSFICMLPGCIAYILLSESFIELIKGRVTKELVIGILIIVLLFILSLYLKRKTDQK